MKQVKKPNEWEMNNDFMLHHNGYEKLAYIVRVFKNGNIVVKFRSWPHSAKLTYEEFRDMRNATAIKAQFL